MQKKKNNKINILGQEWEIKLEPGDPHGDDPCFGLTDVHRKTITLYTEVHKTYPKNELASTLFHEILHAALATPGIGDFLEDKTEELIISCLENAVWPLVKSNFFSKIKLD